MTDESQLVNRQISHYHETAFIRGLAKNESGYSSLRKEILYHNDTGEYVTISDRTGIQFQIKPSSGTLRKFRIHVLYEFDNTVEIDPVHAYITNNSETPEIESFTAAIKGMKEGEHVGGTKRKCAMEYAYTTEEIEQNGGVIYITELDLMISIGVTTKITAAHPYSYMDMRKELILTDHDVNTRDRFGLTVYIISNKESHPGRFINVIGEVKYVPSSVNIALKDGVYIVAKSTNDNAGKSTEPKTHFVPLKDINTISWLYKTREEAEHHNFDELRHEVELARTKIATKEQEQAQKIQNMKLDLETTHAKRVSDLEEHYRRLQEQHKKDYYEQQSHSRKDTTESLKMTPIIVTAVIATLGAIWKFSK
jgi:hypothetical protein